MAQEHFMSMLPHRLGLAIHIEPEKPIELTDLLSGLKSIGREYQHYSRNVLGVKDSDASKLYVGSVSPGSIDVFLQPEFIDNAKTGLALLTSAGPVDAANAVLDFANKLGGLIKRFETKPDPKDVSIRECENVMNITKNTVDSGGSQVINYVNVKGDFSPIINISTDTAKNAFKNASEAKAELEFPKAERKNSVAMIWKTFDRSPGKTEGQRSPDKGLIEEIHPAAKSILFGDDEAGLKADILASDENPMLMLYYVDVEIVRVDDKIKAYRIVGFSGKEPLEETPSAAE
ncbi:hypothetical protein [Roseibium sp. RKSG952]|uniref:hypothetical protein n=1 Tax=Roseibium sp. RKSG952 TaxID=2529384 RepID=UPI0012BB5F2F|nr:hypothetical protein [Roseibium sp. RKSG952]MTH95545.1 hypothetical protein [Roseibium sp. RKSG952]